MYAPLPLCKNLSGCNMNTFTIPINQNPSTHQNQNSIWGAEISRTLDFYSSCQSLHIHWQLCWELPGAHTVFLFQNWGVTRIFSGFFFSLQIVRQHRGLAQSLSCWDTPGQAGRKAEERPINQNSFPVQWLHTTKYCSFFPSQAGNCTVEKELGAKLQSSLENRLQVTHRALS